MRDLHRRPDDDSCLRGCSPRPRAATTTRQRTPAPATAGAYRPAAALAAGLAAAALLAACSGQQATTTPAATGDTQPLAAATSAATSAAPTTALDDSTPAPGEAGSTPATTSQDVAPGQPVALGETVLLESLELTVSLPEPYSPSLYAVGHEHDHAVAVEFRVVNRGTELWDPAGWLVTVRSAGVDASAIYDDSLDGPPLTPLPSGTDAAWTQAWSVADPDDLDLRVTTSLADATT